VVALSQLDVEQRPDKRPVMSDCVNLARLSKMQLILFIYRTDEVYNLIADKGTAEIIVDETT
jgi:replicative DNA helicase